jgi:hypothetical protein
LESGFSWDYGLYHRGSQSAQERDREQQNTRDENTLHYTRSFGQLAEQYLLTLGESVYDATVLDAHEAATPGGAVAV